MRSIAVTVASTPTLQTPRGEARAGHTRVVEYRQPQARRGTLPRRRRPLGAPPDGSATGPPSRAQWDRRTRRSEGMRRTGVLRWLLAAGSRGACKALLVCPPQAGSHNINRCEASASALNPWICAILAPSYVDQERYGARGIALNRPKTIKDAALSSEWEVHMACHRGHSCGKALRIAWCVLFSCISAECPCAADFLRDWQG